MELLLNPPQNFSIMTGEDVLFYLMLALGGNGGILASAHLKTEDFISVYRSVSDNDQRSALRKWKRLYEFIPLLFIEPSPAPIKYCLKKQNLISSSETRLPILEITENLKKKLDNFL
jgi:4-hydroxy-tetrahydrodipicolinate synthase